jgi:hypothetical protein
LIEVPSQNNICAPIIQVVAQALQAKVCFANSTNLLSVFNILVQLANLIQMAHQNIIPNIVIKFSKVIWSLPLTRPFIPVYIQASNALLQTN